MEENKFLNVYSEIGQLKKVLVHRPGKEIENLTPELMERLLFDDIPFLDVAQKEHDNFVELLRDNNVEVYYLKDLIVDTLQNKDILNKFINEFISDTKTESKNIQKELKNFLKSLGTEKMIDKMIEGIRTDEISIEKKDTLSDYSNKNYQFIADPMPNLYLIRDPFAPIGNGIAMSHMKNEVRRRELIFSKYIINYNEKFTNSNLDKWYSEKDKYSLEGGDIEVLSDKILAIGISKRTIPEAIDKIGQRLLNENNSYKTVLAFDIPKGDEFLHLDTVFTMLDYNKFIIHPDIEGPMKVYSIQKDYNDEIVYHEEHMTLEKILSKYLNHKYIELIRCGGHRGIDASREQWSNGTNILAIAPGKIVANARNHVTNDLLANKGLDVNVISSSELSRGHGGPRCMALPLERKN